VRRVAEIEVPKSAFEQAELLWDNLLWKDGQVRGGLDDALDKLARRDKLRRRAVGEATGTPPPVTELVEAIAAVVAHNPTMGVTVGVEGAGDPLLLHFYFADGQVQVNADNAVGATPAEEGAATPRHADFEIDLDEDLPSEPADDQDHFGTVSAGYRDDYAESETAERRYDGYDAPSAGDPRYATPAPGESSQDLGARMRDLGMARSQSAYPPHPFAATPPPEVPPQVPSQVPSHVSAQPAAASTLPQHTVRLQPDRSQADRGQAGRGQADRGQADRGQADRGQADRGQADRGQADRGQADRGQADRGRANHDQSGYADATRRIRPEQYRAPAEPSAAERIPAQAPVHPISAQPRGSYPVGPQRGDPYPGNAQPEALDPRGARPGSPYPGIARPESSYSGSAQPGNPHPHSAQPGSSFPDGAEPGRSYHPGSSQPGSGYSDNAQPGGSYPRGARPGSPYPDDGQLGGSAARGTERGGGYPDNGEPAGSYVGGGQPRGPYPGVAQPGSRDAGRAQPGIPYPDSGSPYPGSAQPGGSPGGARSRSAGAQPGLLPKPLPKPIPLQVERPEETEMAARRVAALLRDDPSLLSQPPD
jgi:hypothetical protein